MKTNIYQLLNQVETDFSEYNEEPLNELQSKSIKNRILKGIHKTPRGKVYKRILAAACICLCASVAAGPLKGEVHAAMKYMSYHIGEFLDINQDLTPYEQIVNKSVENAGIKMTLNSVILDENELIVSTTCVYEKPIEIENDNISLNANIFVNGRRVTDGSSGGTRQVDAHTTESVMNYDLNGIETGGVLNFELEFYDNMKESKDTWDFAFGADGSELCIDTVKLPLENRFTLPNNSEVTLNQYTSNALGQKIYFTVSKEGTAYNMKLEGIDNMGNKVSFTLSRVRGQNGRFNIDELYSHLSQDASSLNLKLYAVEMPTESGKMSNDFQSVGEPFTIQLK